MTESEQDRLYPIQRNDEYGIIAGRLEDAPVLIRFSPDNYLQLTFSEQGDLLSAEKHPYGSPTNPRQEQSLVKQRVEDGLPIRVKKFFLPEPFLGIQDLPSSLTDTMKEQADFDEEESAFLREELDSWQRSQQFVLHWDNEYYTAKMAGSLLRSRRPEPSCTNKLTRRFWTRILLSGCLKRFQATER